jgi:hypothetical protein
VFDGCLDSSYSIEGFLMECVLSCVASPLLG